MGCSCQKLHKDKPPGCANCRFGECPGCNYPYEVDCRRHAPTENEDGRARWPRVYRSHWCGDYEARVFAEAD